MTTNTNTVTRARVGQVSDEDDDAVLDAVGKWLEQDVRAHVHALEHDDIYPAGDGRADEGAGAVRRHHRPGLRRARALGHHLCPHRAEGVGSVDVAGRHLQLAPDHGGVRGARRHRGAEARYLPRFATGELRGGLALTEPDCGTDLQAIRTRAVRATTPISSTAPRRGSPTASTPGVRAAGQDRSRGPAAPQEQACCWPRRGRVSASRASSRRSATRASISAELIFEDYRVSASALIGGAGGRGLQTALGGLELGRINVAARGCGLQRRRWTSRLRYAQLRRPSASRSTSTRRSSSSSPRWRSARKRRSR